MVNQCFVIIFIFFQRNKKKLIVRSSLKWLKIHISYETFFYWFLKKRMKKSLFEQLSIVSVHQFVFSFASGINDRQSLQLTGIIETLKNTWCRTKLKITWFFSLYLYRFYPKKILHDLCIILENSFCCMYIYL